MAGPLNLFVGKASSIIRVLLVNNPKTWTLRELAKESGVSLGWTSKVSEALIRERLAIRDSERAELKLIAPEDLLRRWASFTNFEAHNGFINYYSAEPDISKFLSSFKGMGGPDYAITGLAGALLTAPLVKPSNTHIYVRSEGDAKAWAQLLGLSPVESDGNVKFAVAADKSTFYGSHLVNGVRIVSDVQLFVDLFNYPNTGREAAEEIFKVIERRWKSNNNNKRDSG
ncbi:MAG: type IV toxin-antitoxin system AbiEi family antitoxin [Candidatus Burarchaeum sp.]|nr:type IV toxin-antitoxin system AbiEi family antitoxin [Candidatus Burarchaeum sp.]MDO8339145.1 type IV toxin-antitoxin system AbiEi family antitoxin [Candidatus Burarchaeum sp.]